MQMTFNTNTQIAPICDVGTYDGSPFSWDMLWSGDAESEREEGRYVCDDYDCSKLGDSIVAEANRIFDKDRPLQNYGVVAITATGFRSPREYNFMSDWLELTVTVDDSFWTKARTAIFDPKNRAAIVEYAGNHWVSYDGFSSAMLNRISCLSRDTWKAKHNGLHMATDEEVEEALVLDLEDAFEGLATETSEDEFREFGAILALLWLIEYPDDFSDDCSCGGWMTEEMTEHLRGNSSLSQFCTVLEQADVDKNVGDSFIDFDGFLKETQETFDKYVKSGVGKESQDRARSWLNAVKKDVDSFRNQQAGIIENHAPKWGRVAAELDDLRTEWEARLLKGWPGAWK